MQGFIDSDISLKMLATKSFDHILLSVSNPKTSECLAYLALQGDFQKNGTHQRNTAALTQSSTRTITWHKTSTIAADLVASKSNSVVR